MNGRGGTPFTYTFVQPFPNILSRLAKFKKVKTAVDKRNWVEAAEEMKNSLWYKQVGVRGGTGEKDEEHIIDRVS